MLVLILERASEGLRGELTRWLLEPHAGVFVGRVSGLVRDKLWERVCEHCRDGAATLIYSGQTEQGFRIRTHGQASRQLVDHEGLMLVRTPPKRRRGPPAEGDEGEVER